MAGVAARGSLSLLKTPNFGCLVAYQPYSTELKTKDRSLNVAAMKRGRGGRSSFSGDIVTVFGANGFVGRAVSNRLGKNGSQMIFPYRGDHYKMMRLKVAGDLGQVLFCPYEMKDEDAVRRAIQHSNIVINLVGRGIETSNFSFEDVNVRFPAALARICREMGVKRLVHMSSISARAEPERAFLPKGSKWLKTKYEGELAVRDEFPDATIFRASDIYGEGDTFVNQTLSMTKQTAFHGIPLYMKGLYTVKQPVWRTDLVSGIINSLHDPAAVGQTYEAVGPQRLTHHELVRYIYHLTSRTPEDWNFKITELMLDPMAFAKAWFFGKMPIGGIKVFHQQSLDQLERSCISDESEGYPNLEDLGVKLHTLEQTLPYTVRERDFFSYYEYETVEEQPVVPPPATLTFSEERELKERRARGYLNLVPALPF